MTYQTDSDGNIFINSSFDGSYTSFQSAFSGGLTAAFGSGNWAANIPLTTATITEMRIEWRPNSPSETLTGAIALNVNQPLYRADLAVLNANARFGVIPFNDNDATDGAIPVRGTSGVINTASPTVYDGTLFTRFYATMSNQELVIVGANADFSQYGVCYQGLTVQVQSPFTTYPRGCVGWRRVIKNQNATNFTNGHSVWADGARGALLTTDYTIACQAGTGTFGGNLWMTDLMFRFNAPSNNNGMIGLAKNLKIAVGSSVVAGSLYNNPVDSGSPYWLCVGAYGTRKLMLRVKT